jgi:hypothetical protein
MLFYFTRVSSNRKTGPMPVVTASKKTCPTSCPLQDNGCYAEAGPLAILWRAVSSGSKGISFADLSRKIRPLPRGQIWRYGQAGDLPGEGDEIDGDQLGELAAANRSASVDAVFMAGESGPGASTWLSRSEPLGCASGS